MISPAGSLESEVHSRTAGVEGESGAPGETRPVARAGRFVRRQTKRFMLAPLDPKLHEERGVGWRASWREGAEKLVLQRVPTGAARKRRFVPRPH
jgi:hypothetical protein